MQEKRKGNLIRSSLLPILSILFVVLYPCLFIFFNNIDMVNIGDVIKVIALFILNAAIVLLILIIFFQNVGKASLLTNFVMIIVLLFGVIEKAINRFFPMLYYWHIMMLLFSIIVLLGIIIKKQFDNDIASKMNIAILIISAMLILFNGIIATPTIAKKFTEATTIATLEIQKSENGSNANFYYFIFDEYGGLENVERYCGYDNTPFYDELEKLGFNVSKGSRNNTINTNIEIPNLLNLEEINNLNMTSEAREKALERPYLFLLFKENGYKLNIISDQNFIPINGPISYDFLPEISLQEEETIEKLIIKNSIYYPYFSQEPSQRILEINELFNYIDNSWKIQPEYLFTFGYIKFPHMAFVTDEFGNKINEDDMSNSRDSDVYLGQFKYCSKKILEAVEQIIEEDPDAIIILQSDHGFRQPMQLEAVFGEKVDDMESEIYFERNILNAVYFHGEEFDIESLSGINTLIQVVNSHFDMDFNFLE